MFLNEQILGESQIIEADQSKLPNGILARVLRTVCEFDVLNANKRKYSRELWEQALSDPNFKQKLENRQILGEMEHPVDSQIKLDKDRTSHVVSDMYIDEATNSVKAEFDLLPTSAGTFIHILHEAGVQVTASLRADGELEEAIDEAGQKYHRVIPDAYRFITIDHTGDPSFSGTEPENVLKTVKSGYEAHKVNKDVAIALCETVKTDEARALEKAIREDKQHEGCECTLGSKGCTGSCSRVNENEQVKSMTKLVYLNDTEYEVDVNVTYSYDSSYGEDADGNRGVGAWSIEDINIEKAVDVGTGQEVDITPAIKSAVNDLLEAKQADEGELIEVDPNEVIETIKPDIYIGAPIKLDERVGVISHIFPRTKKVIVQFSDIKETLSIEECVPIKEHVCEGNCHEKRFPEEQEGEEKKERADYDDAVQEEKPEQEMTPEEKKEEGVDEDEIKEAVELAGEVETKAEEFLLDNWNNFLNTEDAAANLVKIFHVAKEEAGRFVQKLAKGMGRISHVDYALANEQIGKLKIQLDKLLENYATDCVKYTAQLNKLKEELKESNKLAEDVNDLYAESLKESKDVTEAKAVLTEREAKLEENITQLQSAVENERELHEAKVVDLEAGLKEAAEKMVEEIGKRVDAETTLVKLKEAHVKEIQDIKEAQNRELIKSYVSTKTTSMGLKLHENVLTLLGESKTVEEVDRKIRKVQDTLREGIVHYTGLKEIIIEAHQEPEDPVVKKIGETIGKAFESFNGKIPKQY